VGDSPQRAGECHEFHTLLLADPLLPRAHEAHAAAEARRREKLWQGTDSLLSSATGQQSEVRNIRGVMVI